MCHTLGYFQRLYIEISTEASRGGIIVLMLFFYTTYLFALVFYHDAYNVMTVDSPAEACGDLSTCYIRLVRLSFYGKIYKVYMICIQTYERALHEYYTVPYSVYYTARTPYIILTHTHYIILQYTLRAILYCTDGDGFDFLEALVSQGYTGYAILLMLYLIFCAIILLNGLIGIFGNAFQTDDDDNNTNSNSNNNSIQYHELNNKIDILTNMIIELKSELNIHVQASNNNTGNICDKSGVYDMSINTSGYVYSNGSGLIGIEGRAPTIAEDELRIGRS